MANSTNPLEEHRPQVTLAEVVPLLQEVKTLLASGAGNPSPDGLIGKPELAKLMGIGESTLDKLRAIGDVGPGEFPVGTQIRWHLAEVQAWFKHRQHNGNLHTAETWPAVWASLNKSKK